jgi:hypothetical protein
MDSILDIRLPTRFRSTSGILEALVAYLSVTAALARFRLNSLAKNIETLAGTGIPTCFFHIHPMVSLDHELHP